MQIEITPEIARKVLTTVGCGLSRGMGERKPDDVQGGMCIEAAVCYALGLPHSDDPGCVAPALRSLIIKLNDDLWSSREARAKGLRRLAVAQLGSKDHLDVGEFVRRLVEHAIRKSVPLALRAAALVTRDEKHEASLYEAANRCEEEGTKEAALEASNVAIAAYIATYDAAKHTYAIAAMYAADAAKYAAKYAANADAAMYAAKYAADAAKYAAAKYDADADADADAAKYAANAYAIAAMYAADAANADADAAKYAANAADADAAAAAQSARDKSLADYAEVVVQILIEMQAPGCQWLKLTEAA